ncbi:MAG: DUF6599 family protein [Candidatus Hydrogenedentales bacterium]
MSRLSALTAFLKRPFVIFLILPLLAGACAPEDNGTESELSPRTDGAAEPPRTVVEAPAPDAATESEEMKTAVEEAPAASEEIPHSPVADQPAIDTSIKDAAEFGDDALVADLAPEGWEQSGDIELYNVATLYNKINGRSELYMSYDVLGLSWVSFVNKEDNAQFIDVFLYDMRSPTGAFGIYSVEREAGQEKLGLGDAAYRTGANIFFWKGEHYGYIQASDESAKDAVEALARSLLERLPASDEPVLNLELVPTEGMVEDTLQFFRADAMSLDFMSNTFTAHYLIDGTDMTAFMSRRDSAEEAAQVKESYAGYLEEYGEDVQRHDVHGIEVIVGDLGGGFYDAVFASGDVVGGISATEGADAALKGATALIEKLGLS